MAVNKVVMNTENGAEILIDLTGDSVTPETLAEGATAHDASGEWIIGTMPTDAVKDPFFLKAEVVDSVSQMTDKTKLYVLRSTGNLWMYQEGESSVETVTEQIVGTADNQWGAGRLSSGDPNGAAGYVTTPYIDLTKYSVPFTLHLKGIPFSNTTPSGATASNLRFSFYGTDKSTHLITALTNESAVRTEVGSDVTFTDVGDGTVIIDFTPTVKHKSGVDIGYARFSGYGTEASANVYITYEKVSSSESGWVDTGINRSSRQSIPESETLSIPITAVKNFMDSAEYNSNDYSYTQVTSYTTSDGSRTDLPNSLDLTWQNIENAILYAVSVNSQTYYTAENEITLSNFIPNTDYNYSIYALCADGTIKFIESGLFETEGRTRMLNIEGIQNVRDVGGYTGLNGKKVRYGLIYRGSAMDEDSSTGLITEAGKHEMVVRLGIGTDVDLRSGKTVSALGVDFINTKYGYEDYPEVITNATQRGQFKSLLESIVVQLRASKPVYIHCSGGCDRTGSLVFLLLGLIGVSESDLAKEYELSSFSVIGKGRTRNSTSYKYKEMVDALKAYSGATFNDKFVSFATDCGVTSDTVASFRNMMLE